MANQTLQKTVVSTTTVDNDDVTAAYSSADDSTKQVLEQLFPDVLVSENTVEYVQTHIKTYDDALAATGMSSTLTDETLAQLPADAQAYLMLRVICAAINGLKADTLNSFPAFSEDEQLFYPSFIAYTTSAYNALTDAQKEQVYQFNAAAGTNDFCALAPKGVVSAIDEINNSDGIFGRKFNAGSRLALKSYDRAQYCGEQFIQIWANFLFSN